MFVEFLFPESLFAISGAVTAPHLFWSGSVLRMHCSQWFFLSSALTRGRIRVQEDFVRSSNHRIPFS